MEKLTQILEAILFASGSSKKKSDILALMPDVKKSEFEKAIDEIREKYSGDSGVILLEFNDKLQFSTNPAYGETVAEVLKPLKEKELSRTLLEVLAIIAYKQPITKSEIEKIKSTSADYSISMLTETKLIQVVGRKETVGRPVLYGTTDDFLIKFQLHSIDELPDYQSVMDRLEALGAFHKSQVGLYRDVEIDESQWQGGVDEEEEMRERRLDEIDKHFDDASIIDDLLDKEEEIPDFLSGEDVVVIE